MTQRGRWRLVLARPEAVPASLRHVMARARRHRLRSSVPLLVSVLVVLALVVAMLVVYRTSVLAVRDVRVLGAGSVPAEDIRRAAAVPAGVPLASVDLTAVARRVDRLPQVRSARVTRDWPHSVLVTVTARTAVAAVPLGARYQLVDRGGVVFRTMSSRPAGLPLLVVSRPGPDSSATRSALQVLANLTTQLRTRLVRLEAPRSTRIRLVLRAGRTVVWGDSSHSARKAAAATALLGRSGHTIDVSAPDLVTVR